MISPSNTTPRLNRTICMHVCQAQYYIIIEYAIQFRIVLGMLIKEHPELFPARNRLRIQNEGDQSLKKDEPESQKNSDSWCLLYNKAVFCDALYDWICKRC